MDRNDRRFSITMPQELAAELAAVKEDRYSDETQGGMLRDLIARGITSPATTDRPCSAVPTGQRMATDKEQ